MFQDAQSYTGIDIHLGDGVDVVVSSYDMVNYFDCQFDIVLCLEVLEHDPHPQTTVREIYNILKPGGTCIITAATLGRLPHEGGTPHYRNISLDDMVSYLTSFRHKGIEVAPNEAGTPDIRSWAIKYKPK